MVELACLRGIHVIEGKHNLIKRPIQISFCKLKNTNAYFAFCSISHQETSSLTHDVHIDVPLIAALGVPHNHLEDEKHQGARGRTKMQTKTIVKH